MQLYVDPITVVAVEEAGHTVLGTHLRGEPGLGRFADTRDRKSPHSPVHFGANILLEDNIVWRGVVVSQDRHDLAMRDAADEKLNGELLVRRPVAPEPHHRIRDLAIRNEAGELALRRRDDLHHLLVERKRAGRQVHKVDLLVPVVLISKLLDLPEQDAGFRKLEAAHRKEPVL